MIHDETARQAIAGAGWLTLGTLFQKALQILTMVILARLLTPADFGTVAVAVGILVPVLAFKEFGVPTALIHRRERLEEAADALFLLSAAGSLLIYAVLWPAAPLVASLVRNEAVGPVLRSLGLLFFVQSISLVPQTLAARELQVGRQVSAALLEAAVTGVVAVWLAARGLGLPALVWGSLAGPAAGALFWWTASPWRPSLRLVRPLAREMAGVGAALSGAAALEGVQDAVARALVGRFLGAASLGHYDLGNRAVTLPYRQLVWTVGQRVAMPAFCQVQEDIERLRRWYLKMLRWSTLAMFPVSTTLLLAADLVVPEVFGAQWVPAIVPVRIMALGALLMTLLYAQPLYVASGRGRDLLWLSLGRFTVSLPVLLLAATRGLAAVCLAQVLLLALLVPVNARLVSRIAGVRPGEILRVLLPTAGAGLVFVMLFQAARAALAAAVSGPLVLLAAALVPALAAYCIVAALLMPGGPSGLARRLAWLLKQGGN